MVKSIVLFFLWSFQVQAQTSVTSPPSIGKYQLGVNSTDQKVNLGILGAEPRLSYQLLRQEKPQSLQELTDLIEQRAPEMFQQAVIIHSSGSLQPSQPHKPRVILYGDNLSLSVSLLQEADPSVEILQFNKDSLEFTMHEIVFPEGGQVRFNDSPQSCTLCHGEKPKPVWEAYDFWPSAVGSQSGGTHSQSEKDLLEWVKNTSHTNPILKKVDKTRLKESIDTFTAYITQQNFLRGLKKLDSHLKPGGNLHPYRYALLGILSCTDKSFGSGIFENIIYKDFLPASLRDQWSISFDQIYYDVEGSNQWVKDTLWDYYSRVFADAQYPGQYPGGVGLTRLRSPEIVQSSQLGYIFANLGMNLRDLTVSMREDSYIMSTPTLFEFDLQKSFLYFMPELLDELSYTVKDIGGGTHYYYDFDCDQLKEKSTAELESLVVNESYYLKTAFLPQKDTAVYGACLHCHSRRPRTGMQPPYIPFDNTFMLGEELRNTGLMDKIRDRITRDDIKTMPKDLPHLTQPQINRFMKVMEKIKN